MEPHRLLALYHTMVMARAISRRLWTLSRTTGLGVNPPPPGFEAVQVAAAAALRPGTDWVVPHSGDLALCLALGLSPLEVMLGVLGRAEDPGSAGRQSPGELGLRRARIASTSPATGTQIVHAAGIAYATRLRALDEITLTTIDERGTDSGDWHEGINFAAVHRLPLICLVEDGSDRAPELPGPRPFEPVVRKANGYGIAAESVDGTDFAASLDALTRAADRARSGEGPTLLHARVIELRSRTPRGTGLIQEELESMSRRDPIERMRKGLRDSLLLGDETDEQIQLDCISVVEVAIEQAMSAPYAQPAAALDNVFQ